MAQLEPGGGDVQLGELTIRTPGLDGTAVPVDAPAGPGLRAAGGTSEAFQAALDRAGMETTHVIELDATPLAGFGGPGPGRAGGGASTEIELDVPAPAAGFEQAVLSVDANGVTTWSFAPPAERGPGVRGPGQRRTFRVRRHPGPPPEPGAAANRAIFGEIGKQVLKVVAFPVGQAVGRVARSFIEQWEHDHQGYGVRNYSVADYTAPAPYFDGDAHRWSELAEGRTLLFIHGTFSRAHGAFNELPPATMTTLGELYGGRVIAFDHESISSDPAQNIAWLLETIPDGLSLDLDIVCHSRGGLVARSLTEYATPPLPRNVRIHRTALVGTVDNGTILADVNHWNELIDTLSTVLNVFGIAVSGTVDLVLAFVRQVALAAYPELKGLACMVPGSDFLEKLNGRSRGTNEYLGIASNFEPLDHRLRSYFNDVVRDGIFGSANDSMVRIDSVLGGPGAGSFQPITEQLILDDKQGIEHARYFGHPRVSEQLIAWLGAGLRP